MSGDGLAAVPFITLVFLTFNKSKLTTQDLGNTNFSIILPRLLFTRSGGAQLVAKAIRDRLSVPSCTVNDRNDVVIRDPEPELKAGRRFLSHFN